MILTKTIQKQETVRREEYLSHSYMLLIMVLSLTRVSYLDFGHLIYYLIWLSDSKHKMITTW